MNTGDVGTPFVTRLIGATGRVGIGARRGIGRGGVFSGVGCCWISIFGDSKPEGASPVATSVFCSAGVDVPTSDKEAWGGSGRHSTLGLLQRGHVQSLELERRHVRMDQWKGV